MKIARDKLPMIHRGVSFQSLDDKEFMLVLSKEIMKMATELNEHIVDSINDKGTTTTAIHSTSADIVHMIYAINRKIKSLGLISVNGIDSLDSALLHDVTTLGCFENNLVFTKQ